MAEQIPRENQRRQESITNPFEKYIQPISPEELTKLWETERPWEEKTPRIGKAEQTLHRMFGITNKPRKEVKPSWFEDKDAITVDKKQRNMRAWILGKLGIPDNVMKDPALNGRQVRKILQAGLGLSPLQAAYLDRDTGPRGNHPSDIESGLCFPFIEHDDILVKYADDISNIKAEDWERFRDALPEWEKTEEHKYAQRLIQAETLEDYPQIEALNDILEDRLSETYGKDIMTEFAERKKLLALPWELGLLLERGQSGLEHVKNAGIILENARKKEKDIKKGLVEVPAMTIEMKTANGKYVRETLSVLGVLPKHPDNDYSNPEVREKFDQIVDPSKEKELPEHPDKFTDPGIRKKFDEITNPQLPKHPDDEYRDPKIRTDFEKLVKGLPDADV